MKTFVKISIYMLLVVLATGCKDKENELGEADRIFRPVGLQTTTSEGIGICDLIVSWAAMPGVKTYTIELYSDSLQFAPEDLIEKFVTDGISYTFPSLRRGSRVSLRLRSNSDDLTHDSRYVTQTLTIPLENIFFPSQSGDVKATSITVRFPQNTQVTILKLINLDSGEITIFPLSDADIAAGIYKMTGVEGNSNFRIEIYYEDEIRGQKQVTTAYAPTGPNVENVQDGVTITDLLTNPDNIGKILILPIDYSDTIASTITIVGGMTIYGNPDGDRANISTTSGAMFVLPANATSDPIEFVYCNLDRGADTGLGTGGSYMFNMNGVTFGAGGSIAKLAYTNCRIANFGRGFFRVQGTTDGVVDSLVIDNCEIHNVGVVNADYAFMHIDVAAVGVSNIVMRNSTFDGVGCHFIYFGQDRSTTQRGCKSVSLENNTFYRMMYSGSSRWFINLGNVNNPFNSTINLKGLILGSTVMTSTAVPLPVHYGIKRDNVTITVSDVYQTNDWVVQDATAIDGAAKYNGSATDLFTDPNNADNANFSIKDATFIGKGVAGDPRWN